jgi:hypothetical protein
MYFCPKCGFLLDITKVDTNVGSNTNTVKKKSLNNINSIIKKILNDDSLEDYNIMIDLNSLEDNSKYKKLSNDNRIKVYNTISENVYLSKPTINTNAGFACNNCAYTKNINDSLLLYSKNFTKTVKTNYNPNDYKLIINDNTLPRTRDYNCKNINCITNDKKNKSINKEAVFFRSGNFDVTYVCTICAFGWTY